MRAGQLSRIESDLRHVGCITLRDDYHMSGGYVPQLPSGRHFAISAESLVELFKRVLDGFRVDELMAIVSVEHLLNHIDVLCFRSAGAATRENTERTAEGSAPLSKGLVSYRSEFTVGSIQARNHDLAKDRPRSLPRIFRTGKHSHPISSRC